MKWILGAECWMAADVKSGNWLDRSPSGMAPIRLPGWHLMMT